MHPSLDEITVELLRPTLPRPVVNTFPGIGPMTGLKQSNDGVVMRVIGAVLVGIAVGTMTVGTTTGMATTRESTDILQTTTRDRPGIIRTSTTTETAIEVATATDHPILATTAGLAHGPRCGVGGEMTMAPTDLRHAVRMRIAMKVAVIATDLMRIGIRRNHRLVEVGRHRCRRIWPHRTGPVMIAAVDLVPETAAKSTLTIRISALSNRTQPSERCRTPTCGRNRHRRCHPCLRCLLFLRCPGRSAKLQMLSCSKTKAGTALG